MVELYQPALLTSIAREALAEYIMQVVHEVGAEGSVDKLTEFTSIIKENIHIPRNHRAEFVAEFLLKFNSDKRPAWQNKAALKMIVNMNTSSSELRCGGPILKLMELADGDEEVSNPRDTDPGLQYPHMKRLVIEARSVTEAHLRAIAAMFPNLTYLKIRGDIFGELLTLRSLDGLTGLELKRGSDEVPQNETWPNIQRLLKFIGANITTLKIPDDAHGRYVSDEDLNFVFQYCPNVENLDFDYRPFGGLKIPPFERLKRICFSF